MLRLKYANHAVNLIDPFQAVDDPVEFLVCLRQTAIPLEPMSRPLCELSTQAQQPHVLCGSSFVTHS